MTKDVFEVGEVCRYVFEFSGIEDIVTIVDRRKSYVDPLGATTATDFEYLISWSDGKVSPLYRTGDLRKLSPLEALIQSTGIKG